MIRTFKNSTTSKPVTWYCTVCSKPIKIGSLYHVRTEEDKILGRFCSKACMEIFKVSPL